MPAGHELAERFERVQSGDPPIDLAFIGPSTVRCAFDPRAVDTELARLGHPVRSLNLGLPGASSFEIDHLIERLAGARPPGLRWLVIELLPARTRLIRGPNRFSARTVYWHTPRQTMDVLQAMRVAHGRGLLAPDLGLLHLRHALWRFTSLGQAEPILRKTARTERTDSSGVASEDPRGFAPDDCLSGENVEAARRS